MPAQPISMRKLKDVLRLKYDAGLSQRQIAAALGLSLGVVNKYLNAAQTAELTWPLPEDLSEAQLRAILFPPQAFPPPSACAHPDFAAIHQELRRKGVTRMLLWQEYAEANPGAHYQYSQFCFYYRQWSARLKLSMRQTHRAGEKMFVDYAGQTVPVINGLTGEIETAQIFVAVLGASSYTYAEATPSQKLPCWIGSHVRAFEFFGGVPKLVIPDNLKSGVTRADRYEPTLNRSYQEMLAHYSTAALPARPRKPKDKAKVEVAVQIVERWILARLRHQQFFTFGELNRAIQRLLEELNTRSFKKQPGTRRSQFESLDQPALGALPSAPYQFAEWKKARVHLDYHIELDGHYYSVPHSLVSQQVDVRVADLTVECFYQHRRVASHIRADQGRKGHTTVPDHMPSHHRAQSQWNPERFLKWAAEVGPHTQQFVRGLLESRQHPELSYRSCLGLLNLARHYTATRLEAACQRALLLGARRQRSVRTILECGLDSQPLPDTAQTEAAITLPVHQNLRGAAYYQ